MNFLSGSLITLITVALLGIFLWKLLRFHWTYRIIKMVAPIPGPKGVPILGSMHHFMGSPEHSWKVLRMYNKTFDGFYKVWGGNRCAIIVSNPNEMEAILSSSIQIEKSELYRILVCWLGDGLLISGAAKWKNRRKILTPAFHFNILKEFVEIFEKHSVTAVEKIQGECMKECTDIIPIITEFALYSLCETTMGVTIENEDSINVYKNAIHRFGELYVHRVCRPWLYSDFIFNMSSTGRETLQIISILHKFTKDIIDERLRNWDLTKVRQVTGASGKTRLAMLDLLIKQMKEGADIDYNGICEEVDTFMFEGHDTTSMALSFCVFLLANHPEIQEKIYEEQKSIFGDDQFRKGTYDEIQSMFFLERCIKESLRMFPPVPFISRRLSEDLQLDKYTLPAAIYVHIMIYDLHHNPEYWPNPHVFDPDRFTIENTSKRHPFAYVPFSAGSRNCIGQRFAMLEMKSFISHLIRGYILEPVDTPGTLILKADIVIRPSDKIRVKFHKRIS